MTVKEFMEMVIERFEIDYLDGNLPEETERELLRLFEEIEEDERCGRERQKMTPEQMAMPIEKFIVEYGYMYRKKH